jgi:hypothetical protein
VQYYIAGYLFTHHNEDIIHMKILCRKSFIKEITWDGPSGALTQTKEWKLVTLLYNNQSDTPKINAEGWFEDVPYPNEIDFNNMPWPGGSWEFENFDEKLERRFFKFLEDKEQTEFGWPQETLELMKKKFGLVVVSEKFHIKKLYKTSEIEISEQD